MASYEYNPWGNALVTNDQTAVSGQPLRYAGYTYDTETKLYYLQARYYDPSLGRYLSRDDPMTQNGYTYADNNPVMMVDPDGKWALLAINAAFAIYDGYKTYKAGGSKKEIAWAVASNFIKIGKVKKLAKFVKGSGSSLILKDDTKACNESIGRYISYMARREKLLRKEYDIPNQNKQGIYYEIW